jgi:TetR/AcrR family transcriptional regulator, acrAB operon repressor
LVRRTKEDALETREKLLDSAECLFQAQGVSRTSLEAIARRAGASRGAIYWHFKDKAALFNAMMERITLPLETAFDLAGRPAALSSNTEPDPLLRIRQATLGALSRIVSDGQMRRVLEVATHKVEYVEELQAVRVRHITVMRGFVSRFEQAIENAAVSASVPLPMPAATAALGFHALIDGLIQNWLLEPPAFDLLEVGGQAMDVYLDGLGFAIKPKVDR